MKDSMEVINIINTKFQRYNSDFMMKYDSIDKRIKSMDKKIDTSLKSVQHLAIFSSHMLEFGMIEMNGNFVKFKNEEMEFYNPMIAGEGRTKASDSVNTSMVFNDGNESVFNPG